MGKTEAIILSLVVKAHAINAEIEAMKAHPDGVDYFLNRAGKLFEISKEIESYSMGLNNV